MRLIDVDAITDDEIISYLGIRYTSCKEDIRDMLDEQPTLDEKEIIRKAFERVIEQLNGLMPIRFNGFGKTLITVEDVIKILKEECGINE